MRNRITTPQAARALAALGHESRLAIFRLLVRAGEGGLNVGDIAAHARIPASTLAHHLNSLAAAGLITQQRLGRETINRAAFPTMWALTSFLTEKCCAGVAPPQRRAA